MASNIGTGDFVGTGDLLRGFGGSLRESIVPPISSVFCLPKLLKLWPRSIGLFEESGDR